MSDQNEQNKENKPTLVGGTASPASSTSSAHPSARTPLLTESFEVLPSPTPDELIRLMARMANYMNLLVAEALRARNVTAANPSVMSMMNASANLEQGAQAERQVMAMRAQGQFVGGGPGGPGGGVPPGMPPFRMN
jgi:hypothetical protein